MYRIARQRLQSAVSRAEGIVRNAGGEGTLSEYRGRMCLALPGGVTSASGKQGLVLGSSIANGVTYFEPQVGEELSFSISVSDMSTT